MDIDKRITSLCEDAAAQKQVWDLFWVHDRRDRVREGAPQLLIQIPILMGRNAPASPNNRFVS